MPPSLRPNLAPNARPPPGRAHPKTTLCPTPAIPARAGARARCHPLRRTHSPDDAPRSRF